LIRITGEADDLTLADDEQLQLGPSRWHFLIIDLPPPLT
jgi:hypothetical protein